MAHQTNSTTDTSLAETTSPTPQREFDRGRQYIQITGRVERPMNSHGAVGLTATESHRTFQIVDYATDGLRQALAEVGEGQTVDVRLVELGSRGNAWRIVAVGSKTQPTDHSRDSAVDVQQRH